MEKDVVLEALDQIKAGNSDAMTEELYVYLTRIVIEQESASHTSSEIEIQRKEIKTVIALLRLQKVICSNPWKKFVIGLYISFFNKKVCDIGSGQGKVRIIEELTEIRYSPKDDRRRSSFEEKFIEALLEMLNEGVV